VDLWRDKLEVVVNDVAIVRTIHSLPDTEDGLVAAETGGLLSCIDEVRDELHATVAHAGKHASGVRTSGGGLGTYIPRTAVEGEHAFGAKHSFAGLLNNGDVVANVV
jgi:hypothetical protein